MALAVLLITTVSWWGTTRAPFHYDDRRTVQHNLEIRELGNIPGFVSDFFHRGALKIGYALNYSLGAKEADGSPAARSFHAVNVALHSLNAVLAFALTLAVLRRRPVEAIREHRVALAAAVALLFSLHPIHGMAVSLVASRAVVQAGTFSLLALVLLLGAVTRDAGRGRRVLLLTASAAMFLCALGSKSVAVSVLGLGILLAWALAPQELSPRTRRTIVGSAVLAAVAGGVIMAALGREVWQSSHHGPGTNLLTQAGVVTRYLALLFWPGRLSVEHDVLPLASPLAWPTLWPALVMGVLLVAGVMLVLRRSLLGLCLGWFLLALAPSSSIVPRAEAMVEYRTYLAVLGFAGAVLWLICRATWVRTDRSTVSGRPRAILSGVLCGLVVCAYSVRTMTRHRVYADPVALWTDAVEKAPGRPRPVYNLGTALALAGRHAEALPYLQRAVELQPDRPDTHSSLGSVLATLGRLDASAVELGLAARRVQTPPQGLEELARAVGLDLAREQWRLGNRFAAAKRYAQAVEQYRAAIQANPSLTEAYYNLGAVLESLGQFGEAALAWRAGLQRAPDDAGMITELAWQLAACPDRAVRDGPEAVRLAERAVRLTGPTTAELLDLLAASYAQAGRFDQAAETAWQACRQAEAGGQRKLAQSIRARQRLYAGRQTLGQPP